MAEEKHGLEVPNWCFAGRNKGRRKFTSLMTFLEINQRKTPFVFVTDLMSSVF